MLNLARFLSTVTSASVVLRAVRSAVAGVANRLASTTEKIERSLKRPLPEADAAPCLAGELRTRRLFVVQALCDARKRLWSKVQQRIVDPIFCQFSYVHRSTVLPDSLPGNGVKPATRHAIKSGLTIPNDSTPN